MAPKAEFFIPLVNLGLTNAAGAVTWWRTQQPIDTAEWAGDALTWTFEATVTTTAASMTVELVYSTTINSVASLTSVCTLSPANSQTRTTYRGTFTPYNGLGYYFIRTSAGTAATLLVYSGSVKVEITNPTKAVSYIPMLSGGFSATLADNATVDLIDSKYTATYAEGTPRFYAGWKYVAAEWADISAVVINYLAMAQNASYTAYSTLETFTAAGTGGTALTGAETSTVATANLTLLQTGDVKANLTDGNTYNGVIKGGATSSRKQFLGGICVMVKLSNAAGLSKFAIHARVRHADSGTGSHTSGYQRIQLNSSHYDGASYYTESTGLDATNETSVGVGDVGASDTAAASSSISSSSVANFAATRGLVRSAGSWTAPTDGNRVAGYKPATTGTVTLSDTRIVILIVQTGTTFELALTSESVSAIVAAGTLTHATWELALTSESKSAIVAAGTVVEAPATYELAFTSESKSSVVVAGSVAHQTLELALASEAKSEVTVAGSVSHQILELALTSEANSAVVVAGSVTEAGGTTHELALTSEAKSAIEVTGGEAGGGTPAAYVGVTSNTSAVDTPSSGPMGLSASATGRASGDLLIVEVTQDSTSRYFNTVTGWTCQGGTIGSAPVVSGNHGAWLFTRVADGTSADDFGASLSGTTNWAAAMVALHGALDAVGTPHVDHSTAPTGGGTTSSEATHDISVTTSVNDCVVAVFCGIDSSAARSFTSWDGLTERLDFGVASAGYIYLGAATGSEASAGAKTYTVTPSSTEWGIGWAVSIKGIGGTTYELALTSEAVSAVVITGSVAEAGVTHELALTSEAKSAVVVVGSVSHAVWELALASEAVSAVVVIGSVAEGGVTQELALASEAKSAVVVAGSVAHQVLELALASEAKSAVTVAGSVAESGTTHELALASEAVSNVTIAGAIVHATWELALASESVSSVVVAGSAAHQTLEMNLTSEAKSAVVVTGTAAHAVWELALASEAVSSVTVAAQKNANVTRELELISEAVSRVSVTGTRDIALNLVFAVTLMPNGWQARILPEGWTAETQGEAWAAHLRAGGWEADMQPSGWKAATRRDEK